MLRAGHNQIFTRCTLFSVVTRISYFLYEIAYVDVESNDTILHACTICPVILL